MWGWRRSVCSIYLSEKAMPAWRIFFFKQKTAYEIHSYWSSDVCSSDLVAGSFNVVQKGQVVPVKVTVGCNAFTSGLSPLISIRSGDYDPAVDPSDPSYDLPVSVSSADKIGRASCRERV